MLILYGNKVFVDKYLQILQLLPLLCSVTIFLMLYVFLSSSGREFSPQGFYALMFVVAIPLFYFASAGSTVFWIIGERVCVCAHFVSETNSVIKHQRLG